MRALMLFVLFLCWVARGATVTVDNSSTNAVGVVLEDDSGVRSDLVAAGGRLVWSLSGDGTLYLSGVTNSVSGDRDWWAWVNDVGVMVEAGAVADAALWPAFIAGLLVGCLFHAFGWQLRMVRFIGGSSDV